LNTNQSYSRYSRQRRALVETLKEKGIKDQRVLDAIKTIPRHVLVESALVNRAYEDRALPIGCGQTISQPYTVAAQTELLNISQGDKVLEIGTGSGYQAAILCEMGGDVYSVERHEELYHKAKENLREFGFRPHLKLGDGTLGWKAYAPYNAIVVTAGAPVVPDDLVEQLTIGGVLVVPVGDQKSQVMVRITRTSENDYEEDHLRQFKFVPLIGEKGWSGSD